MDPDNDPQLLEQLRLQLETSEGDDEPARAALREIGNEVNRALSPLPQDRATQLRSLRGRLQEGVQRFETSHPELTATMAQVIDQLAIWGI